MLLNKLNIYMENGQIQCRGHSPIAFFPIRWQIDWSFNSGASTASSSPVGDYMTAIFRLETGKIFPDRIQDNASTNSCTYSLNLRNDDGFYINLQQENGPLEYSASGTIIFLVDYWGRIQYEGLAALQQYEAKTDLDATVEVAYNTIRFPNAQFTHNITMLRGDQ